MLDDVYFYICLFLSSFICFQHRDSIYALITFVEDIIRPLSTSKERGMQEAAAALSQYSTLAGREASRMRNIYGSMSWKHREIGYELGYTRKLAKLDETIQINAVVIMQIAEMYGSLRALDLANKHNSICQSRDVLKQIVREWSVEGAEERAQTFSPILDTLARGVPSDLREKTSVLVPGAGLARLAWEISSLGFDTTSNELSPYMNLAFRFLTSRSKTWQINQHKIHPFAYWFSHQRSNENLFRSVNFPDVLPSLYPHSTLRHEESDFLKILPKGGGYDYIITHYFIDTSRNIIATLQKVHNLLKLGGIWINLGPLLWFGAQTTMELSLEEIFILCKAIGFDIDTNSRRTIPSEYTRDSRAMMSWIYQAEFWIAVKK